MAIGPAWTAAAQDYTVKPGDTLSHIAARFDVPGGWQELHRLNRGRIDDPDLIFPGQVFRLDAGGSKPKPDVEQSDSPGTVRPATGGITSPYGMRTHPITGVYKLHSGTDYAYGDGRARAAAAGKVTGAHAVAGYGNLVTISHGGGLVTRYAHLAAFHVSAGDRVDAGEVVGAIGSTGYATGPHLHFEVLVGGQFRNPARWLNGG